MVKIFAGDSHKWRILPMRYFGCFKPSHFEWDSFFRENLTGEQTDIPVSIEGDFVEINISPAVSETLKGRQGTVCLRAKKTDFCKTVGLDEVVFQDISKTAPSSKSQARLNLEHAQRALETYTGTNGQVKSYTIGTRSMTFNSPQELFDLVEYWKKQVFLEECRNQGVDPHTLLVRFK